MYTYVAICTIYEYSQWEKSTILLNVKYYGKNVSCINLLTYQDTCCNTITKCNTIYPLSS